MKLKLLPISGKAVWQNNKPFIRFLLSLLLIYSVLKIIFYQYNHQLLFTGTETGIRGTELFRLFTWSITMDLLTLVGINTFLLILLQAGRLVHPAITSWLIFPAFVALNSLALLLNLADIFYYRFHFQRANADLLYVLDHPLNRLMQQNIFILLLIGMTIMGTLWLVRGLHKKLFNAFTKGSHAALMTGLLILFLAAGIIFQKSFSKILVPAYPLLELKSNRLPFVQNSFHTFLFSVFRIGEDRQRTHYMTDAACNSLMPIRKKINTPLPDGSKQNIVLFIMESVPYDFFDTASAYKVDLPFFDSLLEKSTLYNNAFCYAHESNKGITAMLAGIPTVSDIPVYHSAYVNMPITQIGTVLHSLNYHSLFCIGDEYDNFGFAKCMKWLGIDQYYSQEDIPHYKNLPAHTMGLQDEFVLDFLLQKIDREQKPFFAIQYNISTHYPYDIPEDFSKQLPAHYTAPMKAMRYYDHSLQKFFANARHKPWFSNTRFIFCSDHWMFPEGKKGVYNEVSGFRIPLIIYDPAMNRKTISSNPASQFDILETVLAMAGYRDSLVTYGHNLLDSARENNVVFTKAGANLYEAIDSAYVLGFNNSTNRTEFLFNYRADRSLQKNLVHDPAAQPILKYLSARVMAFLQKAAMQKSGAVFK